MPSLEIGHMIHIAITDMSTYLRDRLANIGATLTHCGDHGA